MADEYSDEEEEVGFSSQDSLQRLQSSCKEVMKSMLVKYRKIIDLTGGVAKYDHVTLLKLATPIFEVATSVLVVSQGTVTGQR